MKPFIRFLTIFVLTLCFGGLVTKPVHAMEFRTSDGDVMVKSDEVITGSLFTAGNTIEIDGVVKGDVYCAGKTITIKGSVGGDVLCAGQTVMLSGSVTGSIRTAGQIITMDGSVGRNVNAFGQTVTQGKESGVMGDMIVGGETVLLNGSVGQSLAAGATTATINGAIGGDVQMMASMLDVGGTAKVRGTLTYESEKDARIATGASLTKIVKQPMRKDVSEWRNPQKKVPAMVGALRKPWPMNALGSIVVYIVLGAVMVFLFRNGMTKSIDMVADHRGSSALVGGLIYLTFPMIFLILLVTIIGIPVAVLYALAIALIGFLSKLVVALYIGREIVRSFWKSAKENLYLSVCIGVALSWLVYDLPFVGWLVSCVAMLIGTGAIVKAFRSPSLKKKMK